MAEYLVLSHKLIELTVSNLVWIDALRVTLRSETYVFNARKSKNSTLTNNRSHPIELIPIKLASIFEFIFTNLCWYSDLH